MWQRSEPAGDFTRITRRAFMARGAHAIAAVYTVAAGCRLPRAHDAQTTLEMTHTTSKDGTRIGFTRSGAGPALLLVHGTTADHRRWAGVSSRLEQHFEVFAMDRRGRGASEDGRAYHLEREAEDVAAVVGAIGHEVFVLGHSYGGLCCLEATLLTDAIRRLILYEPPIPLGTPIYPPGVPDRMQSLIDRGELEAGLELFMREVVEMPEHELARYRQLPMWANRIEIVPTVPRELVLERSYSFHPERFARMNVPTLLMLGGNSPDSFRRIIEVLDATLPHSTVVVLPGQQHIAMDLDLDLFVGEVLRFLS